MWKKQRKIPDDSIVLETKARLIAETDNWEDALPIVEKILKKEPDNPTTIALLGDIRMLEGNLDEAERLFLQARTLVPDIDGIDEALEQIKEFRKGKFKFDI